MLKLKESTPSAESFQAPAVAAWKQLADQKKTLGFQSIIHRQDLFEQAKELSKGIQSAKRIVFVGIGGSALGPRFLAEASKVKKPVLFLDNVDPQLFQKTQLEWNKEFANLAPCDAMKFASTLTHPEDDTAFVIVSKSGNTLETLSLTNLIVSDLQKRHVFDAKKFIVVTEKKSNPLFNWAQKSQIAVAEIPVELGGRYSIFSGVGLVLANLLKLKVEDLWRGAQAAQADEKLVTHLIAASLESFSRGETITNFWSYASSLQVFGAWFQQLWAESLGKPKSRASHFVPVVGTMDQHSILQQIAEGVSKQWNVFLSVKSVEQTQLGMDANYFEGFDFLKHKNLGDVLRAECVATAQALESHGRNCFHLELTDLSEFSLGYLMMTAQLWTAGLGFALEINPFDQPGVELGKRLALKLLGKASL